MPFSIDHIVIASEDLGSAIANARSAGFTVVPGGVHGSGNTQNALIGLGDGTYLELFAPTPQGRAAEHRWFKRIRDGGGLVDFCLLCADLAAEIARMRERGIEYSAPFAMARVRPDGNRVEWRLSTPPGSTGQRGWPFLIEDTTPRAIRVPHGSEQVRHTNGAAGVDGITVLVNDVVASCQAYEAILGTARGPAVEASGLFSISGAWIRLRQPMSAEEREHLARHGQGPYQVALGSREGHGEPAEGPLLDPALFSGARVALAR
jgi:hypothetical protein